MSLLFNYWTSIAKWKPLGKIFNESIFIYSRLKLEYTSTSKTLLEIDLNILIDLSVLFHFTMVFDSDLFFQYIDRNLLHSVEALFYQYNFKSRGSTGRLGCMDCDWAEVFDIFNGLSSR